ncbi:hypothetical protein [Paraoerskovia sediminicola]|uniref:hypothetical protein n=1 Tax=Paraoerskovia sediminicola TaxID=1138587 RepID=UPI0025739054|nr:hypothetical protein [Paraoerskovia sediminicola]
MVSAALIAAEEAAEVASEGGISPVLLGVLAFVGLVALLGVTYAFRSVGTRH